MSVSDAYSGSIRNARPGLLGKLTRFACIALAVAFGALALGAQPASAGPYMSSGQWTSDPGVPYSQCVSRAGPALASVGLTWGQDGRFFKGSDAYTTVGLYCYELGGNRFILTVIVAAQAGGTGLTTEAVRDRIAAVIFGGGSTQGNTGGNTGGVSSGGSGWGAQADSFRGQGAGRRFQYTCPAGGSATRLWGTDLYTDDSSVCLAAVHSGAISFANGGTVVIELRGAQTSFHGSTRYGVTSADYGGWPGSFVFVR